MSSIISSVEHLLGAGKASPAAPPPRAEAHAGPPGPGDTALEDARALAASYDAQLAAMRRGADLTGKTLGGVATTAVTALGVTRLTSVFPQPSGIVWYWFVILFVGLGAALAGVVLIAVRLWKVGQPIPSQSDVTSMEAEAGLDAGECGVVTSVYDEAANLRSASSLLAYEARGYRLERVAERLQDPAQPSSQLTDNLLGQAATIRAEVRAAQSRATYLVARRRTSNVFTDVTALGAYGLLVAGLIAFTIGNSYLGARSTHPNAAFTQAQDCANLAASAKTAGRNVTLAQCAGLLTGTAPTAATATTATP